MAGTDTSVTAATKRTAGNAAAAGNATAGTFTAGAAAARTATAAGTVAAAGTTTAGTTTAGAATAGPAMAETVAIRTTGGAAISRTVISRTVICRTVICGTIISGTAMSGTAMSGTAISGTVISGTAISGTAVSGMAVRGTAISRTTIRGTATIRTFTTSVRPQKVFRATIVVMTGIHAGEVDGSKHHPAGVQGRGTPAVQRREGDGGDARHVGGVADDNSAAKRVVPRWAGKGKTRRARAAQSSGCRPDPRGPWPKSRHTASVTGIILELLAASGGTPVLGRLASGAPSLQVGRGGWAPRYATCAEWRPHALVWRQHPTR